MEGELKQVLSNLISNAADAVGRNGTIRVAAQSVEDAGRNAVEIIVEDDGPGIPPEEMDRVFEPFRRLEQSRNRETGGVGLGLPIARNMLRAHGGDVVLSNRPRGGLKVLVTLPV